MLSCNKKNETVQENIVVAFLIFIIHSNLEACYAIFVEFVLVHFHLNALINQNSNDITGSIYK